MHFKSNEREFQATERELSELKQVKEWPIVLLNYVQCSSRLGLFKEFFPENKSH